MKRSSIFITAILCTASSFVFAGSFNYDKQWEKIAALEAESLPKSALRATDSLMEAAKAEKNSPQLLKGWLYRFKFLTTQSPDNFAPELQKMERQASVTKNRTEKAVLHSLLAELYRQYYQQNSYKIDSRTNVTGFIPSSIDEWSVNIFADTIAAHAKASLQDAGILQKTDALTYSTIIEAGQDSRSLQPTLFDFLCARAIETLSTFADNSQIDNQQLNDRSVFDKAENFIFQTDPSSTYKEKILNIYRQWLAFRLKDNNKPALIYTDLERLNYVYQNTSGVQKDNWYLDALQNLRQNYASNESVVEVMAAIANYSLQHDGYDKQKPDETTRFLDYKKRAFDVCEEGVLRFPSYKRINILKSIQQQITERAIEAGNPEIIASKSPLKVKLSTANTSQLEIRLYRIESNAIDYYKKKQRAYRNQISKDAILIETQKINIKKSTYFRTTDTTVIIKTPSYGNYEYAVAEPGITNQDKQVCGKFSVSDLAYFSRTKDKGKIDLYVVNRVSGHPQKGIAVTVYKQAGHGEKIALSQTGTYTTDSNGHCEFVPSERYGSFIQLTNDKDQYFPLNSASSYFHTRTQPENREPHISLFTDRAIYRPGQTVYVKGIVWFATQDSSQVIAGKEYNISLHDANRQEVSKQTMKTNDFGSFSGSFILPKGSLNGDFSINAENNTSVSFSVEEYKRPSFEIKFDTIKGTTTFGDKVTVTGNVRSYADYPISKATIKYRIVKRPHWLMHWSGGQEEEISNGQIIADEKGIFSLGFIPQKIEEEPSRLKQIYTYAVKVEVTDENGETQKNETSLSVGDVSLYINADCKEEIDKAQPFEVAVTTNNLNGEKIGTKIGYHIFKLKAETEYDEALTSEQKPEIEKSVTDGIVDTKNNDKLSIKEIGTWESGAYLIRFDAKDDKNRPVETEKKTILYAASDTKPPVKRYSWMKEIKTNCEPGETADILFGTSAKDAKVLYELMDGNQVLESKWITFDNEMQHIRIPFKKEYDGGITMVISLIKDEKNFSEIIPIRRTQRNTKLEPKFSIFRNKLIPGTQEEWKIIIPKIENKQRQAECMISMYDASLDVFRENSWRFFPKYYYNVPQIPRWSYLIGTTFVDNVSYQHAIKTIDPQTIVLDNYAMTDIALSPRQRQLKRSAKSEEVFTIVEEMPQFKGTATNSVDKQEIQPRQNFAETAFFYPQLRTDEKGEISFTFTVPESLTRWNVMGLAHTKDLFFGQWSAQTVTQKPFMIQPNLPRFVRESDKVVITAKLMNLSEKTQNGTARLEMIDPNTNQPLSIQQATQTFSVEKNGSAVVSWTISGFQGLDILICKTTAFTDEFRDGEQHYLPVLPDKIRVTETMPIYVRGNQTKQFNFDRLLQNGEKTANKSLTVEMSSNPAWYALQALPSLSMPTGDNAISWFCAYYANTLASAIACSNPKIATVFTQWQQSNDALQSPLSKNEELKSLLLTETPWVMEAKNENEQKQRIGHLFDTNQQSENRRQAMEKLAALQLPSGGFAWFSGMRESRFITQFILGQMAHLVKSGAEQYTDQEKQMQQKALQYADGCMAEDFFRLKRYNKEWKKATTLTPDQLYYFYIHSFYKDIPANANTNEAIVFYHQLLPTTWRSCSLYGKALVAITAYREGNKQLAGDIVKSLLEYATSSDEKGMYWDANRSGTGWYESNITTQTAILEAIDEITGNTQQIDEMKRWLLSQKQTEQWHSPIASVEAIQALVQKGSDWLSGTNDATLQLGNQPVKADSKEAGTGYFKTVYSKAEIKPDMGKVTVANREAHPAWGALYWQYETTLDRATAQGGFLNINKKLFIERNSTTGATLEPLTENNQPKVGDKITVRLTVHADRDMEFVALTDQRAACLEPTAQLSGCHWKEQLCYYQSTKDTSTQFFFSFLPKGTYVFEYSAWVSRAGSYANGIATIQCQYAPEFAAHTGSERITVK